MKKSERFYACEETITGNCGVSYLYSLAKYRSMWGDGHEELEYLSHKGGAGWLLSGFVDTDICRGVYEELSKKHNIVFQSELRLNENSDNPFFFCIFDVRSSPVNKFSWPDDEEWKKVYDSPRNYDDGEEDFDDNW